MSFVTRMMHHFQIFITHLSFMSELIVFKVAFQMIRSHQNQIISRSQIVWERIILIGVKFLSKGISPYKPEFTIDFK